CQGLRIGVERYGLKELEPLVGFRREHDLRGAALTRLDVELALEVGDTDGIDTALRDRVAAYNREDCLSAAALRDWLEARRGESPAHPPAAGGEFRAEGKGAGARPAHPGSGGGAARRRARGPEHTRRRPAGAMAAGADAQLLPSRGQVRVVGALPAARAAAG